MIIKVKVTTGEIFTLNRVIGHTYFKNLKDIDKKDLTDMLVGDVFQNNSSINPLLSTDGEVINPLQIVYAWTE